MNEKAIMITDILKEGKINKDSLRWIYLSIFSLACSGLFSLILVLLRVPQIHKIIPYDNFFKIALIAHVDLSVIIWFFTIHASFMVSLVDKKFSNICKGIYYLKFIATILICLSPFIGKSVPYLNNYVPILGNLYFILGLAIYFASYCIIIMILWISLMLKKVDLKTPYNVFVFTTSVISFIAIFITYLSYRQLSLIKDIWSNDIYFFYENLFWGGGHLIQFMYLALGQFAWLYIFCQCFNDSKILRIFAVVTFYINLLFVIPVPYFASIYTAASEYYTIFYTTHMKYFGGVSMIILLVGFIAHFVKKRNFKEHFSKHHFLVSILIFLYGGFIGLKIIYSNTAIPAHYHGSIVGITIGLMGLVYIILEKAFCAPINRKLVIYQAYIYALGQFLHILGLYLSGGYGALRKTPGGNFGVDAKIYLAMIGSGGLLAMVGGLMFVILSYKFILNQKNQ